MNVNGLWCTQGKEEACNLRFFHWSLLRAQFKMSGAQNWNI